MADLIQGKVSYIMDRRTFAIEVSHIGAHNHDQYLKEETVRIRHLIGTNKKPVKLGETKKTLEGVLAEQTVKCRVDHRDSYHRIVADVFLIDLPEN
jgi:endonuclease YncB( thermonuclease family)